jgi:transposase InsO family protein
MFGRGFVPGRDRFFVLLRRKGLMLPKPKPRHTTNSNHRYHKYNNLTKDIVLTAANQLWVADITYIALAGGDVCYLHLITDAYSHKIVGWKLAKSLKAAISIEALKMAVEQAVSMSGSESLKGLIHHSDRGVQYCCDAYVAALKAYNISISMCEDYKPTDNAIAERTNGIIKVECLYRQKQLHTYEYMQNLIPNFIHFYNYHRLHMSIGYKTPAVVHFEQGLQERKWKNKVYPQKQTENENNVVSLQSRTNSMGEGVCQRI